MLSNTAAVRKLFSEFIEITFYLEWFLSMHAVAGHLTVGEFISTGNIEPALRVALTTGHATMMLKIMEMTELVCTQDECGECGATALGCTDMAACNYDAIATCDNDSCVYPGCDDGSACNYDDGAGCDDGSCTKMNTATAAAWPTQGARIR